MTDAPRNVRNNNPGNIRISGTWKGLRPASMMTPEQEMERSFCVFLDPHWGFRALILVLRSYQLHHGIHTLRQAISRWAPPGDNNNTEVYVTDVSKDTGIDPDKQIDLDDKETDIAIARAITVHETGAPFSKYWFEHDIQVGAGAAFL